MKNSDAKLRTLARWSRCLPAGLLLWAAPALAYPEFPGEIQEHLDLACPPPCWLCHDSALGGGPVDKEFGLNMIRNGLKPDAPETVAPALDKIEAMTSIDSDGDGTNDVVELRASRNPNVNVDERDDGLSCGPEYGCGARVAPSSRMDGTAMACAVASAGLLVAFGRRRRK